MAIVSALLGLFSIAVFFFLAFGLIKPSWMRVASRLQVLKRMGIAFLVFVLALFIGPTPPTKDAPVVKVENPPAISAEQENEKLRRELEQTKLEAQKAKDEAAKSKAEADRLEAEKAKAEADRLEAEKAKAEADRLEAEKAKAEADRLEAEKAKAEADRLEAEKAKAEADRLEAEKAKAEADRLEAEKAKAEADRLEAEKAKAEADRLEAEKAKAEADRLEAEKAKAEADRLEAEKAKAEADRLEAEKAKAEAEKAASCQLAGKVVSIADGDTLTVLDEAKAQHKIRLAGIDAPEKGQPYGTAARKFLADKVSSLQVCIKSDKTDKYGRTIGIVLLNGTDINIQVLEAGLAWHYKKYQDEQSPEDRDSYSSAEQKAKDATIGLWSEPNAIEPEAWRSGTRPQKSPAITSLPDSEATPVSSLKALDASPSAGDTCGSKKFCKQMSSCAEACHYLNDCGVSRLDRDGDGRPCESLCHRGC